MDDRETLIRIGRFLGVIKSDIIAQRLLMAIEQDKATEWLLSSAEVLKKSLGNDGFEDLMRVIRSADYECQETLSNDLLEGLTNNTYEQLSSACLSATRLPSSDTFHQDFREYLHRVETTLRGALNATGIKKEILNLENGAAFEAVEELRHIPGRKYGEMTPFPSNGPHLSAVTRYVHSLLDHYEGNCLASETCGKVREILDRLAAYPAYFRMFERKRKAEASRPLTQAMELLRHYSGTAGTDQDKADLLVAISIMLFSIFPSRQLISHITTLCPGPGNPYLQYEYFALLALNHMRMGEIKPAAEYAEKAYKVAQDADMKAYACLLTGCIEVHLREYGQAMLAFEKGLAIASHKTRSLISFYHGVLQYELGDVGLALDCFRDARAGCSEECDTMALCNNIGTCYMALGDLNAGIDAFEEAENSSPYSGRLTARQMRSVTYGNLGIIYMSMREHDLASEYFRKALRAAREASNTRGVANQLANMGLAGKAKHEYSTAARYFTSALNYSCSIDYLDGILYARDQLRQALSLDCRHGDIQRIEKDVVRRHPRFSSLLITRRR